MKENVFIIAEAGVNHNGNIKTALQLIDVAAKAQCDAVKFQSFITEEVISKHAPKARYQAQTTGRGESQYEMVKKLELDKEAHQKIAAHCRKRKILFLSTPFDMPSADMLEKMGMSQFKIPSGEITNLPFLRHIALKKKPVILSTGMSTLGEIKTALNTIYKAGNRRVTLLHCVTAYPTPIEQANLKAMQTIQKAFNVPVGYSDHTLGIDACIAATALGAVVIEKHFTLDKTMPGPDHRASLEPNELVAMVRSVRAVSVALGSGIKAPTKAELENVAIARKSVVLKHDTQKGHKLSAGDLSIKRPGTGIQPGDLNKVIGRILKVSKRADSVLTFKDLK
jgi:N,N'-diacetyllegionaminate synthase